MEVLGNMFISIIPHSRAYPQEVLKGLVAILYRHILLLIPNWTGICTKQYK
jgi:hypothetical protein